ncbi:hypothetical protein [Pseudomonas syringae]|uniref:Uncharacterized protein n=1 Tax=Pseudomonas syringae CC1417 TaxID=1357272 RepID=A0AAU8LDZ8_PSESX
MSEDDSKTITSDDQPKEKAAPLIEEAAAHYSAKAPHLSLVTPSDISETLKAPILPNVNPDAITQEQAFAGISVHIPGSIRLCEDDVIHFYWGKNSSVTKVYHRVGANSIVRVLCISYNFLPFLHYGLVDLYYEVYRGQHMLGTSPVLKVTVNHALPVTDRQRQRKRWVTRRYPEN